ncbi:hypothetical protein Btru_033421 [Bulinus truncatus]|nr:hypothetical protein Btru_033421 [Bulinus truncatus]
MIFDLVNCIVDRLLVRLQKVTNNDHVFIATKDCEIIVFQVINECLKEVQKFPTISEVDMILYNSFNNYFVTIELKKSWKREMKSVYVYLNWNHYNKDNIKPRTKVSVAGKSHIQHLAAPSSSDIMEIIELPVEGNASCIAVCKYTGNFAIACNSEVKLCSIIEKTVANSDKTYLDIEVFLELCWSFPIKSMSLNEEFILCCSHKEVQGVRLRYDEGEKRSPKKLFTSSSLSSSDDVTSSPSANLNKEDFGTHKFFIGESLEFRNQHFSERVTSLTMKADPEDKDMNNESSPGKEFSTVGMRPAGRQSPKPASDSQGKMSETRFVDDEHYLEWDFDRGGEAVGGSAICLPGLHTGTTHSQCHHHANTISPPVLSDFSGGKVKSSTGVQAETILHLCDSREKEDWMNVTLVPTYRSEMSMPVRVTSTNTDRMKSSQNTNRTSMCCYISGSRGGSLYQMYPLLRQVSSYKYTEQALQVGVSQSHLHVVTTSGIETYTSRWGIVSVEMSKKCEDHDVSSQKSYPSSSLDICLCGHEPFFGAVNLSVGRNFLALLSKVYDPLGKEDSHWGIYVLHMQSLVEQYKEMISFAKGIQKTGPASYIHLLQEAHLLLSTHPVEAVHNEVKYCLCEVNRLLGDYYAQPEQEDWSLCCSYYRNSRATVQDIVADAIEQAITNKQREFGKGLLEYLDSILFSQEEYISLSESTSNTILKIYASSAPEKLSKVILLSNMKSFTTEMAYHYLKTWLSMKSSNSQTHSTIDKLAMVQMQLALCDVEHACSQLMSMHKQSLIDICSSHLDLICENMITFTPLAQLMRQHMANTLLEVLVEMLNKCVISLDSLLSLLDSQSEYSYNSHMREVLELILMDSTRIFLFDEAVHKLCKVYIAKLKEKNQPTPRQISVSGQQKFSLPQGDGYFAARFAWLDYLPPFHDPDRISRPCVKLEIKQIPSQGSRTSSIPVTSITKQATSERCHCCSCNESLLKLQSLLCSPRLTTDLATFVLAKLEDPRTEDLAERSDETDYLDSIKLLCLTKLDIDKATEQIVEKYPIVAGSFAACCFKGNLEMYIYLLRHMESIIKKIKETPDSLDEEIFVKSYKDLLARLAETFTPSQFLELLPSDGNIFFLLPFICSSLNLEHVNKLKRKIINMGKELLSHNL